MLRRSCYATLSVAYSTRSFAFVGQSEADLDFCLANISDVRTDNRCLLRFEARIAVIEVTFAATHSMRSRVFFRESDYLLHPSIFHVEPVYLPFVREHTPDCAAIDLQAVRTTIANGNLTQNLEFLLRI